MASSHCDRANALKKQDLVQQIETLQQELAQIRQANQGLQQQVLDLSRDKAQLEVLLQISTEHNDALEWQLFQEARDLQQQTEDLQVMLETTTEHGDTVQAILHEAETRYRSIFENALDGMCQVSPTGHYINANQSLARIYGYSSPQELIANLQDAARQLYLRPELHDQFIETLRQHDQVELFEAQVYRKDHQIIWISQNARAVRDRKGTLLYYEGRIQDITERKLIEQMKRDFVATVSHELRTPLTSIRGALGLIVGGVAGEVAAQVKSLAEIAYRNSERLVLLVNDILDIEKIEAGQMEFDLRPLALTPLLKQSLEANQAYANQFGVSMVLDPVVPEVWVSVDSNRFLQVMANLLSNAAKFSPPGGQVRVVITQGHQRVKVEVVDQGSGIPEEFRASIFQKFAQANTSNRRRHGGTGLGLNICKAIVENMGGSIGFESTLNVGSRFFFDLPMSAGQGLEDPQVSTPSAPNP